MGRVTKKFVNETFPEGAAAFFSADQPVFDLVDLEVAENESKTYMQGWCAPNKDFVFEITEPEETDNGWRVKTLEGKRVFLTPLSKQRGDRMRGLLKEY